MNFDLLINKILNFLTERRNINLMLTLHSKTDFAKRLHEALDTLGWKQRGRARQLKTYYDENGYSLSEKTFQKWLTGQSYPDWEHLFHLVNLTKRTIEYLIYGNDSIEITRALLETDASGNYCVTREELQVAFVSTLEQAIAFNLLKLNDATTPEQIFNAFTIKLKLGSRVILKEKLEG